MLNVNKLLSQGSGLAKALLKRAATVELDWDVRQKSRFEATDSQGRRLGVFLPRGTVVRGGDVLVVDDGSLLRVLAAPQPVLVVRACTEHGSPFDLLRAAYHLGNRHVALELKPDHLKLEPDHVLADMLRRQHLIVSDATEAFEPEGGAYAAAGHGHGHGHEHGQDHNHGAVDAAGAARGASVIPIRAAPVPQGHGPGCGHDHGPAKDHRRDPTAQPVHDPAHGPAHGPAHDPARDPAHDHGHAHGPAHHKPAH
ncbi:MAG: urease accessory protein UreE [Microbacteriaceae bacterium]|nr:urease accessory protein UreE [Burkholderiaceae bacterium]